MTHILRIDSSARKAGSTTRRLTDLLTAQLLGDAPGTPVRCRDLIDTPPAFLSEDWITGSFTEAGDRSAAQVAALRQSDELIDELAEASTIVIGMPIYNFGIPASLKAWLDQVTRVNRTFRSAGSASEGLLENKPAYVAVASAGVPVEGAFDFATHYLRHALRFIGISDLTIIAAGAQLRDGKAVENAAAAISALSPGRVEGLVAAN